jgi:hypothetical protein
MVHKRRAGGGKSKGKSARGAVLDSLYGENRRGKGFKQGRPSNRARKRTQSKRAGR